MAVMGGRGMGDRAALAGKPAERGSGAMAREGARCDMLQTSRGEQSRVAPQLLQQGRLDHVQRKAVHKGRQEGICSKGWGDS